MFADLTMLRRLTRGAETVTESDGKFLFSRFTGTERAVYTGNPDFYNKTFSTAGIRLEFVTDSSSFSLKYHADKASSRKFYYFDIFVNDALLVHEGHMSYEDHPGGVLHVSLPKGTKQVTVYLPCLAKIEISSLEFDNEAMIAPVGKKRKMICFGDSITQGYDALYPSNTYPNRLADALGAELFNKGIGGDIFNPGLLSEASPVKPDLITVAYGTNDYGRGNGVSKEVLRANVELFCRNLTELYPNIPVFAILPLWRKDCSRSTLAGTFDEVRTIIRNIYSKYPEVRVIDGFTLLPHEVSFFSDGYLHPNDAGFAEMSKNLIAQVRSKVMGP